MIYLVIGVLCLVLALTVAFWISMTKSPGNMLYLVMSVIWLGVTVAAFLLPRLNPNGPPWTIPNTEISVGWMGLVFLVYNLARWWTTRKQQPPDRRLLRPIHRAHPPREEPPDTRFQIRDE